MFKNFFLQHRWIRNNYIKLHIYTTWLKAWLFTLNKDREDSDKTAFWTKTFQNANTIRLFFSWPSSFIKQLVHLFHNKQRNKIIFNDKKVRLISSVETWPSAEAQLLTETFCLGNVIVCCKGRFSDFELVYKYNCNLTGPSLIRVTEMLSSVQQIFRELPR